MKLLLLRHGATEGNEKKQYVGSTDEPLSAAGVAQARERAEQLPAVQRVWVSPMRRAAQTAELFYPAQEKRVVENLREMDFGACEGKTWEQINDPSIYDGWLVNDPEACFPEGETLGYFATRTGQAVAHIARECVRDGLTSGAIVAHGGVLMMLLSQFGEPKKGYFEWSSGNCGGFVVEFDPQTLTLQVIDRIGAKRGW